MRGGYRPGAGRKPSIKTQIKRFEERHPDAYDELMEILYTQGLNGESEDAKYVCDRLKGKPRATVGLEEEDRELLKAATVVEFYKLMDTHKKQLKEGEYTEIKENDAIQREIEATGSSEVINGAQEEGVNNRG